MTGGEDLARPMLHRAWSIIQGQCGRPLKGGVASKLSLEETLLCCSREWLASGGVEARGDVRGGFQLFFYQCVSGQK